MERQKVLQFIFERAFFDRQRGETVSTICRNEVLAFCPVTIVSVVPDVVKGEVLTDSRGQGSFQRK
jgi:hypothetical protein